MNRKGKKVVSDINITPFTDVVLVLLIIFMITTPMLSQHEIKVSLPQSAEATEKTEDKVTEILVDKDGFLYLNKKQIHKKYFEKSIKEEVKKYPDRPVVIKGDRNVKYDLIVNVMDKAKKAGVTKFGLATDIPDKKA